MTEIKKLIFFEGAIETLTYFSRQMAETFEKENKSVFWVNMKNLQNSAKHLKKYIKPKMTAMITFNFIGLSGEKEFAENGMKNLWESMDVRCMNLLVDHPMYYHKQLLGEHKNMVLFCLDREHVNYVKRFYPGVDVHFLPTAGNQMLNVGLNAEEWKDYGQRTYDVVFAGNYASLPDLAQHFPMQSKEYIDFYYRIIDDVKEHPNMAIDEAMEKHLKREIPDVSEEDLCLGMTSMVFLDLYVRNYFRAETIRTLAENGIHVHILGKDWDQLHCTHAQNITSSNGQVDSFCCVKTIGDSRISLNTMPWFKDGSHDRIFTSMLQRTLAVTDTSAYLQEELTDGKNVCFYTLEQLKELPDKINYYLEHQKEALEIAHEGYEYARKNHTWDMRAKKLATYF